MSQMGISAHHGFQTDTVFSLLIHKKIAWNCSYYSESIANFTIATVVTQFLCSSLNTVE